MTVAATALEVLQHHYAHRWAAAEEALGRGVGVVGRVGPTVPTEVILASGRLPVLVAAEMGTPTPTAEIYMEPVIPPETKSLFEIAVSGRLASLELLVLSRPYAQLYYYLKEVYRQGRAPKLPPLHMYDLMQSQREAVRAYNWSHTRTLLDCLERRSGRQLTDADLRHAIDQTNRVRALQRQVLSRRWASTLSGVEALQVIGAGYSMPPDVYADALESYLAAQPEARLTGRPRLMLLPSEPLSHVHLHQVLEDAGALVVAEDDWWGSRAPGADVAPTRPALDGIFHKYWTDTSTAGISPAEAREAWFVEHVQRPEVDGVVFYLPPSDHQLGWDYPRLKAFVEERGKPSLLIRHDATVAEDYASIAARVRPWLEGLA
jgi:benzoyl-CoA reductase/2-hydroxyglutaryl-CoA dehydratase subunit BcrC/BadD/HgdB